MNGVVMSESALLRMSSLLSMAAAGDMHALSEARGMLDALIPYTRGHKTTEEKFERIYGKKSNGNKVKR